MKPTPDTIGISSTKNSVLDYSTLTLPVTYQERADYKARDTSSDGTSSYWIIALVGAIFAVVASVAAAGWLSAAVGATGSNILVLGICMWLCLMVLIIGGVRYLIRSRRDKLVRLDRLARANGMSFLHDKNDPPYAGMIFDEGHSRVVNESLTLSDGTEIGNYTYVTGSGKHQTTHTWAFVKVPLERSVPHMVLDAKSNDLFGKFSNLTDTFDTDQTLSLEGDFDSHFTLYAPLKYERDALYIFTPDVMASLIDNGNGYDMEAIGQELYIYKNTHINMLSPDDLEKLLSIVDAIATEMRSQTKRYADERVGDRTMNVVAPQGSRLKQKVNWLVIGLFVLYIGYVLSDTVLTIDNWYIAAAVILFVLIVAGSALKKRLS